MKSSFSPQNVQKYQWQTQIWASICTPAAPSLEISSGHSPRLGGHNFRLGGTAPVCPPVEPGLGIMPAALKCCLSSFSTAIPNILGRGFGSNLIVLDHNPEIELPMS